MSGAARTRSAVQRLIESAAVEGARTAVDRMRPEIEAALERAVLAEQKVARVEALVWRPDGVPIGHHVVTVDELRAALNPEADR